MKISEPRRRPARAIGELAGEPELAHRALARDFLFLAPAQPLIGAVGSPVDEPGRLQRIAGEPVLEGVADDGFGETLRLGGGKPVLGLADEFGIADEDGEHGGGARHHVFGGDRARALVADALGKVLEAAQKRGAQAHLVGAAFRRRDGVAIRVQEAVVIGDPGDGPFDRAVAAFLLGLAGEDVGVNEGVALDFAAEIFAQAVFEVEGFLLRNVVDALQQRLVARPADLDAAEQIGLRLGHGEDALRLELGALAEDFRVGLQLHARAAPLHALLHQLDVGLRHAALVDLAVEIAAARDLDFEHFRKRVRHRHADAVQAARGLVDLVVEFSARVQRRHDHFERGLLLELRMLLDRNAAAVVGDRHEAVGGHFDLDRVGKVRHRLVHGVVDHLGEEVMQRALVGAADIHAGPPPHRLQPPPALRCDGRHNRSAKTFRPLCRRAPFRECSRKGQAPSAPCAPWRRERASTSSLISWRSWPWCAGT